MTPKPGIRKTAITELVPHPSNPRQGDVGAIIQSIESNGWYGTLVAQISTGHVLAGNHRLQAAIHCGLDRVPVHWVDVDDDTAHRILLADNRTTDLATYDEHALAELLVEMGKTGNLDGTGYDGDDLDDLLADLERHGPDADEPPTPAPPDDPITQPGDLILLGNHRLICGDTTDPQVIARLFADGQPAQMIHADPPYGMNKETIAGDNQHGPKLDAFQMRWWTTWRAHLLDNASAYIWGIADDLWRLWYLGGLRDSEVIEMRNEIVWAKGQAQGQNQDERRMYSTETERCLLIMLGRQTMSTNADEYWEGWEPIRSHLAAEVDKMGWTAKDIKRITGVGMYSHWFTKSQWVMIPEKHYNALRDAADGQAFVEGFDTLSTNYKGIDRTSYQDLKDAWYATRAPFNNTHDNMTDVWTFDSPRGDDRHGHDTPKPVALTERAIRTSSNRGDVIAVPFAGTCPEIIAAENNDRTVYAAELDPGYCDVIVQRWEDHTGQTATRP